MFYDPLFDLNRDGRIDAAEWAYMDSVMNPETESTDDETDVEDELETAGLDFDDLADMDEDARREALEDAGLDPNDYEEF